MMTTFNGCANSFQSINHNLYWNTPDGAKVGVWPGQAGTLNFTQWKTACNCDQNSLNVNPVGPENPSHPSTGRLAHVSSRRSPLIVMMQPTYFGDFLDRSDLWPLDRPWHRRIHG